MSGNAVDIAIGILAFCILMALLANISASGRTGPEFGDRDFERWRKEEDDDE